MGFMLIFIYIVLFGQVIKAAEKMTLEKLAVLTQSGKADPVTGKIVIAEYRKDHISPSGKQEISGRKGVFVYNKEEKFLENTIVFDNKKSSTRIDRIDLIDLAKKENVEKAKEENVGNIFSDSGAQIFQGSALLNYFPSSKSIMMDGNKGDTEGKYSLRHYRYGFLNPSWLALDGAEKVEISEVVEAEKNIVIVRSERTDDGKSHVKVVKIDPKIGYRCLSLSEHYDEKPYREIKYENYKNFGGYYLPESYSNKRYTKDGRLSKEIEIIISAVQFDIEVDEDVFSIQVPEGTMIAGRSILNMMLKTWRTEQTEQLTIDSILDRELSELALAQLKMMDPFEKDTTNIIFLPDINYTLTLKEGKGFVFDFEQSKLFQIFTHPDCEEIYTYLTDKKQGDLLWDGKLLTTRNAKIISSHKLDFPITLLEKKEWISIYQLPEKISFPYQFIGINEQNGLYSITIHKIESKGIHISCKRIEAGYQ